MSCARTRRTPRRTSSTSASWSRRAARRSGRARPRRTRTSRISRCAATRATRPARSGCRSRRPATSAVPGRRPSRLGHQESYRLAEGARALTLGAFPDGSGELRISVDSLSKHALIAGATGSGKTTAVLELLKQLWLDHRVPFLVIEPVNSDADDYRRLAGEPGFEELDIGLNGDAARRHAARMCVLLHTSIYNDGMLHPGWITVLERAR